MNKVLNIPYSEILSVIKKEQNTDVVVMWVNLKSIMLSERSHL